MSNAGPGPFPFPPETAVFLLAEAALLKSLKLRPVGFRILG